ncbi:hypothetical protein EAF00_008342 [Botryotinia globosa]|nr:hypothetical protein EAF00_008342 [Botryotinia globosa]
MSSNTPRSKAGKGAEGKESRSKSRERSQHQQPQPQPQPSKSRNDRQETEPATENRANRNKINKMESELKRAKEDLSVSAEAIAKLEKDLAYQRSIRPRREG